MAQPRKSPSSRSSSSKPAAKPRSASGGRSRAKPRAGAATTKTKPSRTPPADAGIRLPGDLVVLTRERIQELFDEAVDRGRMTRDDATELVAELLRRSRRTSGDLLADVEQLLGRSRDGLEDVGRRARRVAGLGSGFPISRYDDLTAAEVTGRLDGLTPAELRKVRDYERRKANRKSVLSAIETKLK
jgi:polyhydroxyalkanoate synthesis regulator phasin